MRLGEHGFRWPRPLIALTVLLLLPLAAAHADLLAAEPADRTVVRSATTEASLRFSEPVEVTFSRFELYRLAEEAPPGEPSEREWQRLSGLAAVLLTEGGSELRSAEARVETTISTGERRSDSITITWEEPLEPGVYVLAWRALSIDTHIVQGFVTFVVAPDE
ncbi:MAG TPA: copper resistance CopC family protein [Trueperaceae bacterium]